MNSKIGVVVIGRNEGERLQKCLLTLIPQAQNIVYVDSGSTDNSVLFATSSGVAVVQLDLKTPFSAGRARNEGFYYVLELWPDIDYVQFIDGDCELVTGWLAHAKSYLEANSSWAIVAGHVKESYPEKSIYNLLCDMEWKTPIGKIDSCGGIFIVKAQAFQMINGFNTEVIAGEEPELCYRLRQQCWEIHKLDHYMAWHDADMTRFMQWWRRCVRSGHAYAQGTLLHGINNSKYCFRDSLRIWIWGMFLPCTILSLTFYTNIWSVLLWLIYPAQLLRIAIQANRHLGNSPQALLYALFNIAGKFPQFIGQLIFIKRKLLKTGFSIIEYN